MQYLQAGSGSGTAQWRNLMYLLVRTACAAALIFNGSQVLAQAPAPTPLPANPLGELFKAVQGVVGAVAPPFQNYNPSAASAATQATAPVVLTGNLAALYAKGTVNGDDLIGTLREIRQTASAAKSARAWAALSTTLNGSMAYLQAGIDPTMLLQQLGSKLVLDMIKSQIGDVAMKALDQHMQAMLDDPSAWSKESISLPAAAGLTEEQATRMLTLATLTVAARLTGQMLDKANKDFDSLKTDYAKLLDQREKAARLLFDALAQRAKALQAGSAVDQDLSTALSADDFKFIDSDVGRMTVKDFAKDLAAQNLALSYLGKKDPTAFQDYERQADDYVVRGRAYMRTISGAVAFGGLIFTFGQTMEAVASEKQAGSLLTSMPLGFEFIKAAGPVAFAVADASARGVVLQPASGLIDSVKSIFSGGGKMKAFMIADGDAPQVYGAANDVYATLGKGDGQALLHEALFRTDESGLLAGVMRCDVGEAGRMLDTAIAKEQRAKFAQGFFGGDRDREGFSFNNTLEVRDADAGELARRVLLQDHRQRSDIADPQRRAAVADVQNDAASQYAKWTDEQLMRLIFANRDGAKAVHATLTLGPVNIRPQPTMQAIYAYEALADACRQETFAVAAAAPPVAPAALVQPATAKPASNKARNPKPKPKPSK
jgi:hypothetical protein